MNDKYILKDGKPVREVCGIYPDGGWFIVDGFTKKEYKHALGQALAELAKLKNNG